MPKTLSLITISKTLPIGELVDIPILPLKKRCTVYLCLRDRSKPKITDNPKITKEPDFPVLGFYIARDAGEGEGYLINTATEQKDIIFKLELGGKTLFRYPIDEIRYEDVDSSTADVEDWLAQVKNIMGV